MKKQYNPELSNTARGLIGDFIRERRNDLGWSQQKLSEIAGIRKATLVDVEMGRPHNLDTLLAILGSMRGKLNIEWADINSIPHFGKPEEN